MVQKIRDKIKDHLLIDRTDFGRHSQTFPIQNTQLKFILVFKYE